MTRTWLERLFPTTRDARRSAAGRPVRFTSRLVQLEDRVTPANFYVDPQFTTGTVDFNPGGPNQALGLTVGDTAFATIAQALTKANTSAGPDAIFLSINDTHNVDPSGATLAVTDDLRLIGSGKGVTTIQVVGDTLEATGDNAAVFRADLVSFQVSDLTIDGGGVAGGDAGNSELVGSAFRFKGATGSVTNVTIRDVIDDSAFTDPMIDDINFGFGIVAIGNTAAVAVAGVSFENIGREGVRFDTFATGSVADGTFAGRTGATVLVQYGVSVTEGATAQITGNTFAGFAGTDPVAKSAAILILDDTNFDGSGDTNKANEPATAVVVGNAITGGSVGILIGLDPLAPDASDAFVQFNTIAGNGFGIVTNTTNEVNALRNFWGDRSGPNATGNLTASGNNPGGAGNGVDAKVLYRQTGLNPNNGILIAAPPVRSVPPQAGANVEAIGANVAAEYVRLTNFDLASPQPTFAAPPVEFNTNQVTVVVRFGEAVNGFDKTDVQIAPGTTAPNATVDLVTASPTTPGEFQVVVSTTGEGNIFLQVPAGAAEDTTGNASTAAPATLVAISDRTAPTIALGTPLPIRFTDPFSFTVVFNERVVGFDKTDIVLGGTAVGGAVTDVTGDAAGKVFTVTAGGFTKAGDVTATIAAGAATDPAGNQAPGIAATLVADGTGPTVTVSSPAGPLPVRRTDPVSFTLTFSEAVTGFDKADVILGGTQTGGTVQSVTPGSDGKTFTVVVGGFTGAGDLTLAVAAAGATDAVGNPTPGLAATLVADGTAPAVTIGSAAGPLPRPFADPLTFTVTFSEGVVGFDKTDVVLGGSATGGTVTQVVGDAANKVFTVTAQGFATKGDVTVTLNAGAATDAAGNPTPAVAATVVADGTAPTVTIASPAGPLPRPFADPLTFTFTFSEAVNGFDKTDIAVGGSQVGGVVQTFAADAANKVFTVTVGGFTTKGDVTLGVAAGAATDAAGNPNAAAGPITVSSPDTTPPTGTIGIAGVQLPVPFNPPIFFTVTFNEPITGFDAADIRLGGTATGGRVASVVPSADRKSFDVTLDQFAGPGDVDVTIPAGVATDDAGNPIPQIGPVRVASGGDLTPPSVTITGANATLPVPFAPTLSFVVNFSEAVSGFAAADVILGGTAVGGRVLAVNPDVANKSFVVQVGGFTQPGSVVVTVPGAAATDAAGNPSLGAGPVTVATAPTDTTPPVLTITSPGGPLPRPVTVGGVLALTIAFPEPVTGFAAGDVTLSGTAAGATVQSLTPAADGKTFIVAIGGFTSPGTVTVTIPAGAAADLVGNPNPAASVLAGQVRAVFGNGFAVGGDRGISQSFYPVDATLTAGKSITPFEPSFTGGVRVGTADVTGDGTLDIIVGSGPGRVNEVKLYDGASPGKVLFSFNPFETTFQGGVFVHGADLDGDGKAELIVTPDEGGGPRVKIMSGAAAAGGQAAEVYNFLGIKDDTFRGGARAGTGDLNADGTPDLFVAAGFLGGPRISIYDGKLLARGQESKLVGDFFGFEPVLRNGAYVDGGDLDGDGFADVILGAGPGGGPRVRVLSGKALMTDNSQVEVANFFAGDESNRGGVRVAGTDADGDGVVDIVTGPGERGGSSVRVYLSGKSTPVNLNLFGDFDNGVFVG